MAARPFRGYSTIRKSGLAARPLQPFGATYATTYGGPLRRDDPIPLQRLYWLAMLCEPAGRSIQLQTDYILKEGWEWVPKWSRKCKECGEEHPAESKSEMCQKCGVFDEYVPLPNGRVAIKKWYTEPDEKKTREVEKFFKNVSQYRKVGLKKILKKVEKDHCIANDAFALVLQDYDLDSRGAIVAAHVKEIVRASPLNFRLLQDPATAIPQNVWFCLAHRPTYIPRGANSGMRSVGLQESGYHKEPGECPQCGRMLHQGTYGEVEYGTDRVINAFLEREVIWTQKFTEVDDAYGALGSLVSIADVCEFWVDQIAFLARFYREGRTPRDLSIAMTNNPEGVRAMWEDLQNIDVSQGGNSHPLVTIQPVEGVSEPFLHFPLTNLPAELQHIENREEASRTIAAHFGVMPPFLGVAKDTGLTNAGPTQRTITALAAEIGQQLYNEEFFPQLLEIINIDPRWSGINDEWELRLRAPEEKNDIEAIDADIRRLQAATIKRGLGFRIKGVDLEGNIEFASEPDQEPFSGGGQDEGETGNLASKPPKPPSPPKPPAITGTSREGKEQQ